MSDPAVTFSMRPVTLRVPTDAARALGVSDEFFNAYVRPEIRVVRRGKLVLVPVAELERWAIENAERTIEP